MCNTAAAILEMDPALIGSATWHGRTASVRDTDMSIETLFGYVVHRRACR